MTDTRGQIMSNELRDELALTLAAADIAGASLDETAEFLAETVKKWQRDELTKLQRALDARGKEYDEKAQQEGLGDHAAGFRTGRAAGLYASGTAISRYFNTGKFTVI
jgi:hypothetical protein